MRKGSGYVLCLLLVLCGQAVAADKGAVLIKKRQWKEAQEFYAARIAEAAATKNPKAEQYLTGLVFNYDLARYLAQVRSSDAAVLTDFLLRQTDFTVTLFRAITPQDSPQQVFRILARMKQKFGEDDILRYAGLAIAHVVVWDAEKAPSTKFDAVDSFEFYIANAGRMLYDLSALPHPAAVFLACAEATPAERAWAMGKCMQAEQLSQIYHSIAYDWDVLRGAPKRISRYEYTLPNLARYGGVCVERAYYAANVARANGIPAVCIFGRGLHGGHAWTGYLEPVRSGRYTWNLSCGRYESERYYVGLVIDPQTRRQVSDYQIAMRTRECSLSPEKLRASYAWLCAADVVASRAAGDDSAVPVKFCIAQALKNNRFSLAAWDWVKRLCKSRSFGPQYTDDIMREALTTFPDEPDFCFGVFMAVLEELPKEDFARRTRLYREAVNFFKPRPDLTVAVAKAYGDYLLEMGEREEAYRIYHETIRAYMNDPRLVFDMAIKVTEQRLVGEKLENSIDLLKMMIARTRKPSPKDPLAPRSAWYRLQACLRGLYEKMGDRESAEAIAAELAKFKKN